MLKHRNKNNYQFYILPWFCFWASSGRTPGSGSGWHWAGPRRFL